MAGDRVYVSTRDGLHIFDAVTGDEVGAHRFTSASREAYAAPVPDDNFVFYGSVKGETNAVFAVDTDGEEQWWRETANGVVGCAVDDENVYVATGVYGDGSGLYAFSKSSGEELWQVDLDEHPVAGAPTVDGERVLLQSGGIASFDTATGDLDWRYGLVSDGGLATVTRTPAVSDGLVVCTFASRSGLFVVDAATGDLAWRADPGTPLSSPTLRDGVAYVGTTDADGGGFYAYDVHGEEELWSAETGYTNNRGAAVTSDRVYATGSSTFDTIHALDRESGESRWNHTLDVNSISRPVVTDGATYLIGSAPDGERSLFRLAIG